MKKVRGRLYDFGRWITPDATLQKWADEKDDLIAGRTPRKEDDVDKRLNWKPGKAERLAKQRRLPHILLPDASIRFEWAEIELLIVRVPAVANCTAEVLADASCVTRKCAFQNTGVCIPETDQTVATAPFLSDLLSWSSSAR